MFQNSENNSEKFGDAYDIDNYEEIVKRELFKRESLKTLKTLDTITIVRRRELEIEYRTRVSPITKFLNPIYKTMEAESKNWRKDNQQGVKLSMNFLFIIKK